MSGLRNSLYFAMLRKIQLNHCARSSLVLYGKNQSKKNQLENGFCFETDHIGHEHRATMRHELFRALL